MHTVSVDDVLYDMLPSIPRGLSDDIDAVKNIDISRLSTDQKIKIYSVVNSIDAASVKYGTTGEELVRQADKMGKDMFTENEIVSTRVVNDGSINAKGYSEYGSTDIKMNKKAVGNNTSGPLMKSIGYEGATDGIDMIVKHKIFMGVTESLLGDGLTASRFDDLVAETIEKTMKEYGDMRLNKKALKSDEFMEYKNNLKQLFYDYLIMDSIGLTEEALQKLEYDNLMRQRFVSNLTEEQRADVNKFTIKKDGVEVPVLSDLNGIENTDVPYYTSAMEEFFEVLDAGDARRADEALLKLAQAESWV